MNRLELIKFITTELKKNHRENKMKNNKTKNETNNKKRRKPHNRRNLNGGGIKEAYEGVFRTLKNLLTKKSDKDEEYSNMSKDYKRLLSM